MSLSRRLAITKLRKLRRESWRETNLASGMFQLAWLMNANGVLCGSIGASTSEF